MQILNLVMVFFNYATMQMAAKIVYYGPGLCGKTTNLQFIYQKTAPKSRGEMVSLETETDRTLFFDLLPLDVGNIAGFRTRFQLYTVPGQVFYNSTRKLVLRGVDGVVFVVDSQAPMLEANIESLKNLKENIEELGLKVEEVPIVLQYNKRDLKNVASVDELNRTLNPTGLPFFEASALQGTGVFETLKGISKATLITLRKKALGDEKPKVPDTAVKTEERPKLPAEPTPTPSVSVSSIPTAPPHQAWPGQTTMPEGAESVAVAPPVIPTAAEIAKETVEFSELAVPVTKPTVKKIAVKSADVGFQLDSLRDLYTGKGTTELKEKKTKDTTMDSLAAILDASKSKERKVSKKLKIRLDGAELDAIKNLSLDFHLVGDNNVHKRFSNAMSVALEGKGNEKKVIPRNPPGNFEEVRSYFDSHM